MAVALRTLGAAYQEVACRFEKRLDLPIEEEDAARRLAHPWRGGRDYRARVGVSHSFDAFTLVSGLVTRLAAGGHCVCNYTLDARRSGPHEQINGARCSSPY